MISPLSHVPKFLTHVFRNRSLTLLIFVLSGVLIAGAVSAATTISTDILTGGVLTVNGAATSSFSGVVSVGSSTPASNTFFQVGTSSPFMFVDKNSGYMSLGKTNPRAPFDFYNENGPGDGYGSADGAGILFTGGIVEMDGLEDLSAGAHGWCSGTGACGASGGESGGPLYRGEANRWHPSSSTGESFTVDIGLAYPIRAITWGTYWKDAQSSAFTDYTIDYSTDGTTWTNAVTATNNTKSVVLHYFDPTISARYIRITNTGANGYVTNLQILGYTRQNQHSNQPWGFVVKNWNGGDSDNNLVYLGTGNVGIGTSSMPSKLTVDNAAYRSHSSGTTLAAFENSANGATSTISTIAFAANDSNNIMRNLSGVGGIITQLNSAGYQGALTFYAANNTTPAEVGRFTAAGNLGIGTTTPATRLHVSNGASATTTISIGELGLTSSKACVNMNQLDGSAGSFYIRGGAIVVESNYCR